MNILELLTRKFGTYENTDNAWVQFVKDHKALILQNSIIREPSLVYQYPHEYNLIKYLKSIAFDTSAMWIVRYINNYDTDKDFASIAKIHIPDITHIRELYELYRTNVASEKSL
jgi:hypothetical protein